MEESVTDPWEERTMSDGSQDILEIKQSRDSVIVRTSILGIVANVLLAAFKAVVGLLSNSIAVVLDAVNNLSDALSSVITIVGTKLAGRSPDKKHPLGHGRIEYLSELIIAAIVLYAGLTSLIESIKKIITPEDPDYSLVSLIVIAAAVLVKILLGTYVKRTGERVNSGSLTASGKDALFDAILSASVLASAVIFLLTGLSLEAFVGVVISVFIVKSGIEIALDTLNEILGKRVEKEYLDELRKTICEEEEVTGAFDLILHNYGPEKFYGSVHVEVPSTMTAEEIDQMERRIAERVYLKHGVFLTGIGIYSMDVSNDEVKALRVGISKIVGSHEGVLQIHGFHADMEKKTVNFDVILDYALKNREELFRKICEDVQNAYPDYTIRPVLDIDVL